MIVKKLIPDHFEKGHLVFLLDETVEKLTKKKTELQLTRQKLSLLRVRLMKMKATIKYQRERIIQLYDFDSVKHTGNNNNAL